MSVVSKPLYTAENPPREGRHNIYDTEDLKTTRRQAKPSGIDPLVRDYKLPSYEPLVDPEIRGHAVDRQLDISDIEGARAKEKFYCKTLHKVPEVRMREFNVKDITGFSLKRTEPYIRTKELMMDVSDIAFVRKQQESGRDPLLPAYDWKDAGQADFLVDKDKENLARRDVAKDSFIYNTRDLEGGEIRDRNIRRRLGHVGEVYTRDCTADAARPKRDLPRTDEFAVSAKFKAPGDEQSVRYTQRNAQQAYPEPPEYNIFEELKKAKVLQKAEDFHTQGAHEIPPAAAPPQEEVYRKKIAKDTNPDDIPTAGINTHGLELAIKHQTIGALPGPSETIYQERTFKKIKGDEADFNAEVEKEKQRIRIPKILVHPVASSTGLLSVSQRSVKKESLLVPGAGCSGGAGSLRLSKTQATGRSGAPAADVEMVRSLKF